MTIVFFQDVAESLLISLRAVRCEMSLKFAATLQTPRQWLRFQYP